jgi:hypothetical protein
VQRFLQRLQVKEEENMGPGQDPDWNIPEDEKIRLRKIKKTIVEELFLSRYGGNIVGVGIGFKEKDRELVTPFKPCVRVYVSQKPDKPDRGELPAKSQIKQFGFAENDTDVINVERSFRIRNALTTPKPQSLPHPGSSIAPQLAAEHSNVSRAISGTLGAILRSGNDSYILSCNHVMAVKGRVPVGAPVFCPAPADGAALHIADFIGAEPIEHVNDRLNEKNMADCALAKLRLGVDVDPRFPIGAAEAPVAVSAIGDPKLGQRVVKNGKATGKTKGIIVDNEVDLLVEYSFGSFRFVDQVLIQGDGGSFADDGDSGSVAITDKEPRAATALIFAPLGEYTAAAPLPRVVKVLNGRLGLNLVLA